MNPKSGFYLIGGNKSCEAVEGSGGFVPVNGHGMLPVKMIDGFEVAQKSSKGPADLFSSLQAFNT